MAHRMHVHHNTQTHYRCLHSQTKIHACRTDYTTSKQWKTSMIEKATKMPTKELNPIYRWSHARHILGLIGIIRGWLIPKLRNWDWVYLSHLAVYCWSVYRRMRIARNNDGHVSYFAEYPASPPLTAVASQPIASIGSISPFLDPPLFLIVEWHTLEYRGGKEVKFEPERKFNVFTKW